MIDESIYDNPQDLMHKRFAKIEVQVTNINYDVSLPMETLIDKLKIIGEDGCSNS